MSTKDRSTKIDAEEKLERIAAGIVDTIFEMSDAEILEEARAAGKDPEATAERVRGVLMGAVKKHRKERLTRARERYEAKRDEIEASEVDLPATAAGRLRLLTSVLREQPRLGSTVTVQHRQLRDLPDEDVISLLRQLAALGAFDEL
ncbi:MAG: hypothetical protein V3T72_09125 [Thermoanaerobaculia bacterium]